MFDPNWAFNVERFDTEDNSRTYRITVETKSRDDFLSADIRQLENWAIDIVTKEGGFVLSRAVTDMAFDFGYRHILITVLEVRRSAR